MSDGLFTRQGRCAALNVTAAAVLQTNQAASYGAPVARIARVSVIVAGSTAGGVYDSATVVGAIAAAQLFVIPNTVGVYLVDMPCVAGLTVVPGTGQTVAVSYD
jgi:Mg2+/citrate symporter